MAWTEGLEPKLYWERFAEFTRIPRCSGNEKAAGEHVLAWAKAHGFEAQRDRMGNVVVRVPATKGHEAKPIVVLQGHLDMVGEKNSDCKHDFTKDPIPVVRKGDHICTEGTTLGADNGVGLAASLFISEDPTAVHGPLELLFTVEEETGLDGANALEPGMLKGKVMLNLDTEEDHCIYVGCAGGGDITGELPLERADHAGEYHRVRVHKMKGGHSGVDINLNRGNALKVLALYLEVLRGKTDYALVDLRGGDKHNAIPREAFATIVLPPGKRPVAEEAAKEVHARLLQMLAKSDPDFTIELEAGEHMKILPLTVHSRDRLIDLMLALPHGVLAMSLAVPGLVETSSNMAVCRTEPTHMFFHTSSRSSVASSLKAVHDNILAIARLAGAKAQRKGGYPGWAPNVDSTVLKMAKGVHTRVFGTEPGIKAIHAGLECGIIGEKFGGMDMISFGPLIEWPHSPSERLTISTVTWFVTFLREILKELAN